MDVWETVVDVKGEEFNIMFGGPDIQLKRVITHFFSNETIMEDMFRQVLIMSLITDYTDNKVDREARSKKEMSYFDFRELNFGDTYLDTFSVADCVTDPAERRYFDIFVKHIGQYSSVLCPTYFSPYYNDVSFLSKRLTYPVPFSNPIRNVITDSQMIPEVVQVKLT